MTKNDNYRSHQHLRFQNLVNHNTPQGAGAVQIGQCGQQTHTHQKVVLGLHNTLTLLKPRPSGYAKGDLTTLVRNLP